MLDDIDIDIPGEQPPEESDNRTFLLVAGGLGGFMLISLICLAVIFFLRGQTPVDSDATSEAINAQNTEAAIAAAATLTAESEAVTGTPSATPETDGATATEGTPGTETAATDTPTEGGPTQDPRTATVQALLTQAALAQTQAASAILTVTPTATLVLPSTGFAEDVGLPGLVALTGLFILVIFFARRLRSVNA